MTGVSHPTESQRRPRHSRVRIHRAIPTGSARAKSQAVFMRALDERIDEETGLGKLRSDAAVNVRKVVWVITSHAHWKTMVSRPGWGTIADRTGLSESTVNRAIRRLRTWGLIGIVATGSTWRTRGGRLDDEDGNLGAEYVLCVPAAPEPVEISDRPSLLRQEERTTPRARTRETPAQAEAERSWPMHQPTATRQDRLQAAQRLQAEAPMLRRITPQLLRHILRPQLTNGWTVADILHALDHDPTGETHWHTADVRHVAAWIRYRLKPWAGQRAPKPVGARQSTMLSAADVAALPRAGERSEADVTAHASLARRLLAATKRRSEKKPARGLGVLLPGRDGEVLAPTELRPPADRNPYAADDPRREYAEKADLDRAKDLAAMAERAEQPRQPAGMGDGFEWLRRGLERRPGLGDLEAIA